MRTEPKYRPKTKTRPQPEPPPDQEPRNLFAIRGLAVWGEWLRRYAEHRGMHNTGLIDFALSEQAKRDGFDPMPRRF